MSRSTEAASRPPAARAGWTRWLPVAALLGIMVLAIAMGWHRYLSFATIGLNYEAMRSFIAGNLAVSLLAYVAIYVAVVALSLPGALILTLAGGLLFGWQIGAPAAVVGATAGATLLFLIVKTSLGTALAERAGPWVAKLRAGFQENALSYLLFLRLVPAFPFFIVNLVPAVLGVRLPTFVIGTALGILPGSFAYSLAGSGLGSVVEAQNAIYRTCLAEQGPAACVYTLDTSALVTRELVLAFAVLGLVALIPVAIKLWSKRRAAA